MFLYLNCKWPSFRSGFWFRLSTVNEIQKQRKEGCFKYICMYMFYVILFPLVIVVIYLFITMPIIFCCKYHFSPQIYIKTVFIHFFTITFFHIKYFTSIQDAVHLYHSHFKAGAFDSQFFLLYFWIIFHFSRLKNMLFIYICFGFYIFIYSFCTICISIYINSHLHNSISLNYT